MEIKDERGIDEGDANTGGVSTRGPMDGRNDPCGIVLDGAKAGGVLTRLNCVGVVGLPDTPGPPDDGVMYRDMMWSFGITFLGTSLVLTTFSESKRSPDETVGCGGGVD